MCLILVFLCPPPMSGGLWSTIRSLASKVWFPRPLWRPRRLRMVLQTTVRRVFFPLRGAWHHCLMLRFPPFFVPFLPPIALTINVNNTFGNCSVPACHFRRLCLARADGIHPRSAVVGRVRGDCDAGKIKNQPDHPDGDFTVDPIPGA